MVLEKEEIFDALILLEKVVNNNLEEFGGEVGFIPDYHAGARDILNIVFDVLKGDDEVLEWIKNEAGTIK